MEIQACETAGRNISQEIPGNNKRAFRIKRSIASTVPGLCRFGQEALNTVHNTSCIKKARSLPRMLDPTLARIGRTPEMFGYRFATHFRAAVLLASGSGNSFLVPVNLDVVRSPSRSDRASGPFRCQACPGHLSSCSTGQWVFSVSIFGRIEKVFDFIDSFAGVMITNLDELSGVL